MQSLSMRKSKTIKNVLQATFSCYTHNMNENLFKKLTELDETSHLDGVKIPMIKVPHVMRDLLRNATEEDLHLDRYAIFLYN